MALVSIDQTVLSHTAELCFAGAACDLHTNSFEMLAVLELLSGSRDFAGLSRFKMRVVVDELNAEPAGETHFRGLHHVVTAFFGDSNVFVFDILRCVVSARISTVVANDYQFWKEKLIPISLGVLGAAMGLVPVHCACLESNGDGLLIAGASGAGKSTLSVALSEGGFNYVSDDWTYISQRRGGIVAHGTSAPVKLLPDAIDHFQSLHGHSVHRSMNGEMAYEVDIVEAFGAQVERECDPRWLIFIERTDQAGADFMPLTPGDARNYLKSSVERLPKQLLEAAARREQTIESVSMLPCWRFRYGGTPQFAARELRKFVVKRQQEVYV
jgi:hypothetical protein